MTYWGLAGSSSLGNVMSGNNVDLSFRRPVTGWCQILFIFYLNDFTVHFKVLGRRLRARAYVPGRFFLLEQCAT